MTSSSYIGIGVVWAAVFFGVGWVMRGAPQATQVIMLIARGVAATFVLLAVPAAGRRPTSLRES